MPRAICFAMVSGVLTACLAGCAATEPDPAPTTTEATQPPPADAATLGQPKLVRTSNGAQASVTLHGVTSQRFVGGRADGDLGYLIADVSISNLGRVPLDVNPEMFSFQYNDGEPDPYHPEDSNLYGPDPTDYALRSDHLKIQTLRPGQRVRGTVAFTGEPSRLLVGMTGPSTTFDDIAQWVVTPTD